jgi:hypothetical protein
MPIPVRPWMVRHASVMDAEGNHLILWPAGIPQETREEMAEYIVRLVNEEHRRDLAFENPSLCVVCHVLPVAPEDGQDTCNDCLKKV